MSEQLDSLVHELPEARPRAGNGRWAGRIEEIAAVPVASMSSPCTARSLRGGNVVGRRRSWWLVVGLTCGFLACAHPAHVPAEEEEERRDLPVTIEDVHILELADAILSDEEVWDRADTRECEGKVKISLFCALHKASIEVLGKYDHRRASLQEVRFVIEEHGKPYKHRMMGFNNDPATTFRDLKQILRSAKERVERRLPHAVRVPGRARLRQASPSRPMVGASASSPIHISHALGSAGGRPASVAIPCA